MPSNLHNLFEKPVDRHIEGVIKADDESDLFNEVSEYVVTKEIAIRKGIGDILVSISHCRTYATAYAMAISSKEHPKRSSSPGESE